MRGDNMEDIELRWLTLSKYESYARVLQFRIRKEGFWGEWRDVLLATE